MENIGSGLAKKSVCNQRKSRQSTRVFGDITNKRATFIQNEISTRKDSEQTLKHKSCDALSLPLDVNTNDAKLSYKNKESKASKDIGKEKAKNIRTHILVLKQLIKLTELDNKNNKLYNSIQERVMPPEKMAQIYEPMLLSDQKRSDLFSKESVDLKLKMYGSQLKNLREQLDLIENMNPASDFEGDMSELNKYESGMEFNENKSRVKNLKDLNLIATENWFLKQKELIQIEFEKDCYDVQKEFEEKKLRLKESLLKIQQEDGLKYVKNIKKLEIDEKTIKNIVNDTMTLVNTNKTLTTTVKKMMNLPVITRSKKKQLPKLRPRLNGRASTASPGPENRHFQRNKSIQKRVNNIHGHKTQQSSHISIPVTAKKSKSTSIEGRLNIKFMLQDDEILNDLKALNKSN